jgi:gliding motility-associated lipoprotein GldB
MRILQSVTLLFLLLALSCTSDKERSPDLTGISSDPEIVRFEQLFYGASEETLPKLKGEFPYLFPEPNPDSVWVNKMESEDERYLFDESQKVFEDFDDQKERLRSLFRHMKYYFPSFQEPRVITMITQVDYNNEVLYADSLLFIGLDLYLGQDHQVYADFPAYVKQNYHPGHLIVDVADAMVAPLLGSSAGNSFLSRIIQQGKRLKMIELLLPEVPKREIMGYTDEQWNWTEISETDIWKYFVQNELLYSTDAELSRRFIEEAPFSKFYLEVDRESPGRIGSWFGWRIVDSYMQKNEAGISDLMRTDNEEIFKRSGYKPRK